MRAHKGGRLLLTGGLRLFLLRRFRRVHGVHQAVPELLFLVEKIVRGILPHFLFLLGDHGAQRLGKKAVLSHGQNLHLLLDIADCRKYNEYSTVQETGAKKMRIIIQIIADLLIAAIALFAAGEYFGLRRYRSFTVPYTDKLISLGVIPADQRSAVLQEDRVNHIVGLVISTLVCALMTRFLAWPTGAIAFVAAFAAACIFTHPDMEETAATREGYFRLHKAHIPPQRYAAMVASINGESEGE